MTQRKVRTTNVSWGFVLTASLAAAACGSSQTSTESPEAGNVEEGPEEPIVPTPDEQAQEQASRVAQVHQPKIFPSFVEFDANGDKEVTEDEFSAALQQTTVIEDWDADESGELNREEFDIEMYTAWDLNGDGKVDVAEFEDGSGAYFPQADAFGVFEDYDHDGDKELNMAEFQQLGDRIHQDWDGDGNGELTDLEFQTALYNAWDLDGDGIIDHYEYRWE